MRQVSNSEGSDWNSLGLSGLCRDNIVLGRNMSQSLSFFFSHIRSPHFFFLILYPSVFWIWLTHSHPQEWIYKCIARLPKFFKTIHQLPEGIKNHWKKQLTALNLQQVAFRRDDEGWSFVKDDTPHLQPLCSLGEWLPGRYTGAQVEPTGKGTRLLFLWRVSQRLQKKHVLIICSDSKAAELILQI